MLTSASTADSGYVTIGRRAGVLSHQALLIESFLGFIDEHIGDVRALIPLLNPCEITSLSITQKVLPLKKLVDFRKPKTKNQFWHATILTYVRRY